MQYVSFLTLTCAIALAVPALSASPSLSQYRGATLGQPVETVVEALKLAASDVKILHEAPALVQQVTWKPRAQFSGGTGDADPIVEMLLTFHAGRLAQITVTYDRARTQGLTDADLLEAMGATYGTSMLVPVVRQPPVSAAITTRATIGRWEDAEALVILWREQFPNRIGLTLTSLAADAALQQAIADGVRLETAAAPGRELARRSAEADAIRARDEKIRLENKAKFKP